MFLIGLFLVFWKNFIFIGDFFIISWYYIFVPLFLFNLIFLFLTFRIFFYKNYFELICFVFLWVLTGGILLFFYQFDAFACIILLSEFVLLMFGLFNIININSQNFKIRFKSHTVWPFFILGGLYPFHLAFTSYYNFFIDFYKSIVFSYNDFIQIYFCLYNSSLILLIIGFFLLFLTLYLLMLFFITKSFNQSVHIDVVHKDQSFWEQLKRTTFINFF